MIRRVLIFAAVLAVGCEIKAHPIHASYAEADYRPESGRLEVALRLFSDDAEAALSALAGKKVRLESTAPAELDRLLLALVQTGFVVKSKTGAPQAINWVGRETKDGAQYLWVYFTCPLLGKLTDASVVNRVLRDAFSDQLNSIRLRDLSTSPPRQTTLLFADDREQAVVFH